jgi:beta-glucosidase
MGGCFPTAGYDIKLGRVAADRTTFARTPTPSAAVLGRVARANAVPTS